MRVTGMPYVPGTAQGKLHRGPGGLGAGHIGLLEQSEIESISNWPAGLVIIDGAPFSHVMIGVMSSGTPTVIISREQAVALEYGSPVLVDGYSGVISTPPAVPGRADSVPASLSAPVQQPVCTADGVPAFLRASVRSAVAARQARITGAEAIGLVRSEFLGSCEDAPPDVDFYRREFEALCAAAEPLAVTIRLLDLAADKMPLWMSQGPRATGVLGLQGVRLFGTEPIRSVLHAQLAAVDQLSDRFRLRLLIPYLVRFEELCFWSEYIRSRLSKPIAIGAMVETPAAALDLSRWLEVTDFVAVGCNDLMQCLFAADRDRPELRNYLDPYAPLLFRLFRDIAASAGGKVQEIQLCGLLPQVRGVLPVLVGLGYRAFSVDAVVIPQLAQSVRAATIPATQTLAAQVCAATESRQVMRALGLDPVVYRPFMATATAGDAWSTSMA